MAAQLDYGPKSCFLLGTDVGAVTLKTVFLFLLIGLLIGFLGSLYYDPVISKNESREQDLAPSANSVLPSFADLADSVSPAVVNISSTKRIPDSLFEDFSSPFRDFFGEDFWNRFFKENFPEKKEKSLGSGFIVAEKGFIVTNAHVIEAAEQIRIRLANGKTVGAKVVGIDEKTDLALIKADSWNDLPPPVVFGNSEDLRVGDWVVAIGNPFGLAHTVTAGIVSGKGRVIGAGPYDDFIQTDASINPGNSGGPLFNIRGEVVGINTALFTTNGGNIGIGFAVPINMARNIIDQLKERGQVTRGWLGVTVQKLTPKLAESFGVKDADGVLIAQVVPDGPAEKAGIQSGDIIVAVGDKKIDTLQELPLAVSDLPIGSKTDIVVVRNGEKKVFTVTVQQSKEKSKQDSSPVEAHWGLQVRNFTLETRSRQGYDAPDYGVIVEMVQPGSPADRAGLQAGDVIAEVDQEPVKTLQDFRNRLQGGSSPKGKLFLVYRNRGQHSLYTVVKKE